MLAARFFFWMYVNMFTTFWKMPPWQFFFGMLLGPFFFAGLVTKSKKQQQAEVDLRVLAVLEAAGEGKIPVPPRFVREGLLALTSIAE